jgi:hypothetical protein
MDENERKREMFINLVERYSGREKYDFASLFYWLDYFFYINEIKNINYDIFCETIKYMPRCLPRYSLENYIVYEKYLQYIKNEKT